MNCKYFHFLIGVCCWALSATTIFAQKKNELFTDACRKGAMSQAIVVPGKGDWAFLKSELRFLSSGDFWGKNAEKTSQSQKANARDPLAAKVAYQQALSEEGIDLLLLPIPPKAVVYPDKLPGPDLPVERYDVSLQRFYDLLRQKGVSVLDVTTNLLAARKTSDEPLYCMGDSHYSGYGCKVVAEALAKEIRNRYKLSGKGKFQTNPQVVSISGDLYKAAQDLPGNKLPRAEKRTLYSVSGKETNSKDSPILVLGDSHTLVFEVGSDLFATHSGLPSLLAAALGMPVDVIGVRGSGATPARLNAYRRSRSDNSFLKKKRLFVWCFAAREFTEASEWNTAVPVK